MASTYLNDLRVEEQATGENSGTWGNKVNSAFSQIAEAFSYGTKQLAADSDETFTMPDGTSDGTRSLYLKITSAGSLTATRTVTLGPNTVSKLWIIENATTGSQSITIAQGSGGTVTIPTGAVKIVYSDGAGAGAAVVDALTDVYLASVDHAAFGDNKKAIFGAGSDLQIYHDGTSNIFAGNIVIDGSDASTSIASPAALNLKAGDANNEYSTLRLATSADGSLAMIGAKATTTGAYPNSVGQLELAVQNGASTNTVLTATSTGIDVTGTVTTDNLTIDGGASAFGATASDAYIMRADGTGTAPFDLAGSLVYQPRSTDSNGYGDHLFYTGSTQKLRQKIAADGDISFYEDTGTTAKLLWDASSESLTVTGGIISNGQVPALTASSTFSDYIVGYNKGRFAVVGDAIGTAGEIVLSQYSSNGSVGRDAVTIDSSGNLLVGKTSTAFGTAGIEARSGGTLWATASETNAASFNRLSSDGAIAYFNKDGTPVGSIGTSGGRLYIGSDDTSIFFDSGTSPSLRPHGPADPDGVIDIGESGYRFKDLYLSGNVNLGTKITAAGVTTTVNAWKSTSNSTSSSKHMIFANPNGNVGDIRTNASSTAYITSSDYRLKENVVAMTGATERLKQLKPSRFNFIADPDTTVDGFLAHEVQEIVPEAIAGEKDAMIDEEYEVTPAVLDDDGNVVTAAIMGTRSVPDYQGIDQSKLVPLLVATIQELEARIAQLEGAN